MTAALVSMPVPKPTLAQVIIDRIREGASLEETKEYYRFLREIETDETAKQAKSAYDQARSLLEIELAPIATDCANPQTRSKYASLAQIVRAIRPLYSKHGIVVDFDTAESPKGEAWLRVLAKVSHSAGYSFLRQIDMPSDGKGAQGRDVMTRTPCPRIRRHLRPPLLLLMIFNLAIGGEDDDGNAAPNDAAPNGKRDNPHTVRPEDVEDIPPPDHPDRIPPGDPDIKPLPKKNAREDFGKMQNEMHAIKGEVELEKWGKASANRIATFPIDWQEIMRSLYAAHLTSLRAKSPTQKALEESVWLVDLENAYENCEDMAEFFKVDQEMYEPWLPTVTQEARDNRAPNPTVAPR